MAGSAADIAAVKAVLARAGVSLDAKAKLLTLPKPKESSVLVVVERVREGGHPDYCGHGFASCVRCDQLCWLGSATSEMVTSQQAYPLCLDCAHEMRDDLGKSERLGWVADHVCGPSART